MVRYEDIFFVANAMKGNGYDHHSVVVIFTAIASEFTKYSFHFKMSTHGSRCLPAATSTPLDGTFVLYVIVCLCAWTSLSQTIIFIKIYFKR